ncbi:hypothetical protein ACFSTE_17220 [Aquimarina hainanensis]|uniref:Leucine-rich repeat domain-containing protein n=1 Tax=Aquimarina hainanensis TaxID=1578017 RepID=A0ABW5NBU0_9FLAO
MKTLKYIPLITVLFIYSCSRNDDATVALNLAPKDFNVTPKAADIGLGITLSWEASIDPENEKVIYDIIVNDETVEENTTSLTYSFDAGSYGIILTGKIVAKDESGNKTTSDFSITSSDMVYIPDSNFEQSLIDNGIDNGDLDQKISYFRVKDIKVLDAENKSIADLTGIEAFSSLEKLYCAKNNISNIDISNNNALTLLSCFTNNLKELDVQFNTELIVLACSSNQLEKLDVSSNKLLKKITCSYNNSLSNLNIANGNNHNFSNAFFNGNPNLSCIQIDAEFEVPPSNTDGWVYDTTVSFKTSCL